MASLRHQIAVQLVRAQPRALKPSLETIRILMDRFGRLFPMPRESSRRSVRIGVLEAEWVGHPAADADRLLLYLHGGGYCSGSLCTHRALAARLALAADAGALLLDYRRAPEDPFPAALEDALSAYRHLLDTSRADRLVVAGDSAGGGLTLALLMALAARGEPLPAAAFCMSPWTDLAVTGESARSREVDDPMLRCEELIEWARLYAGETDVDYPLISPLYGSFRGFPPLLLQVGTRELLFDDSRRVADRARAAGVEVTLDIWPEMMHVWQVFAPLVPESVEALARAGRWIRDRTSAVSHTDRAHEEVS